MITPKLILYEAIAEDEREAFASIEMLCNQNLSIDPFLVQVKKVLMMSFDNRFVVGCNERRVWIVRKEQFDPTIFNINYQPKTAEIIFSNSGWNDSVKDDLYPLNSLVERSELVSLAEQVHEVRLAQNRYFALKRKGLYEQSRQALQESIRLETALDGRVRDILKLNRKLSC
jgi:hypothetical protein